MELAKSGRNWNIDLARSNAINSSPRNITWEQLRATDYRYAATRANPLGYLPILSVSAACGLLILAIADNAGRNSQVWAEPLFWVGLFVVFAPIVSRLFSAETGRRERLALVLLLALALYFVKVLHSPVAFTFADEIMHLGNANQILEHHRLFIENPIFAVSALYPGLETAATALANVSGVAIFLAGLVVIGAARIVSVMALFLLHEEVSGSTRVAGIAAVLYMASPNFLFWSAQFSYESLALPIAILVLWMVLLRESAVDGALRSAFTIAAIIGILAVVATHHLTSYALVAWLWILAVLYTWLYWRSGVNRGLWFLTLFATVATLGWLVFVASLTVNYLSPVLGRAMLSLLNLIAGEAQGRELFRSTNGSVAPLWERATGITSVLFLTLGMPFGLLEIWRRYRHSAFALLLTALALIYFPLLALRFTGQGWETSNRSSDFLFIGISFVVALGVAQFKAPVRPGWITSLTRWWHGHWRASVSAPMFAGYILVIFFGGIIAGWIPSLRVAWPYEVQVGHVMIESQGVAAAKWTRSFLGVDKRIGADSSNAPLMFAYGGQYAISGREHAVQELLEADHVGSFQLKTITDVDMQYVAVDRRLISWDNMLGLYLIRPKEKEIELSGFLDPQVFGKFDRQRYVSRIFDSGEFVIYDVGALNGGSPTK